MDLDVVFRESGCTSEGGVVGVDPVLRVEGLLASRDLAVTDVPGFLGTAASSCDS